MENRECGFADIENRACFNGREAVSKRSMFPESPILRDCVEAECSGYRRNPSSSARLRGVSGAGTIFG